MFNKLPLLAFIGAAAACDLANKLDVSDTEPTVHSELCLPQGEGSWTFSMLTSASVFPSFSAEAPWAGYVGNAAFEIYDHTCSLKAVYNPHQDNDCGVPYVIRENFLPYVLTVKSVNFAATSSDASFAFDYGDGTYVIKNNQCVCNEIGGGLQVNIGCRCAFPLDGTFDG